MMIAPAERQEAAVFNRWRDLEITLPCAGRLRDD